MNAERLATILIAPHASEKSADLVSSRNQYVFKVRTDANKAEIRKAVEMLFEVKVEGVQVLNRKGKTKRYRTTMGRRSDWKKAFVRLAEGDVIESMRVD